MKPEITELLNQLTLEEKLRLLSGADKGFTAAIPRLGIPRVLLADGPHGVRVEKDVDPAGDAPYTMTGEMAATTAFPCEAAMAATWNAPLVETIGRCIGSECRAHGVSILLGPGVNGKRSPLGGRNFEYFSEDPYLSGKLAAAMVRGIQSAGTGACLKHYALNDQETRRTSVDVHADERTKHEIYLKPFEIAIRESDPWAVMAAYNKVDGEQMTENRTMLTDVLRKELGFRGAVISDWGAVKDKADAIHAGLSLQMPGPDPQPDALVQAVRDGRISENDVNERTAEVLALVLRAKEAPPTTSIDWQAHHAAAVQAAAEGMVLLKNTASILPLQPGASLAIIGEPARDPLYVGGGSSSLTPHQADAPLDCLAKDFRCVYATGWHGSATTPDLLRQAADAARTANAVLVFAAVSTSESLDRTDILLPQAQLDALRAVAAVNANVVLITQCGSAIDYSDAEPYAKAILHAWIPGEGFGTALADILSGRISPSGKLAETFPMCLENTPAYPDFPGVRDDVYYSEGLLVGYRYYDTKKIAPRYPFGFGLSYTAFALRDLRLSARTLHSNEGLTVTVEVENTGTQRGQEVVQVYLHDEESCLFRPAKELKAFVKVALAPGEKQTVTLTLGPDAFRCYLPHLGRFAAESGTFTVLVGTSSRDIRLSDTVELISNEEVRLPLDRTDSFKDFLADDRYKERAGQFLTMLHIDETHMFYQMLLGVNLYQITELLTIMGIPDETAEQMIQTLLG